MRSYSWKAMAATTSAMPSNAMELRNQISASVAAARTTPLITRVIVGLRICSPNSRGDRWSDAAESPIPFLVREHSFEKMATAEIRPQRVGHPDLGVGDLPEQEVAD